MRCAISGGSSLSKMRIVHVDTDDIENPLRGGASLRTFEVNSRLSERHDITVFTATYPGSSRHVQRGRLSYRRLGVTIPRFGLSSHLSYLAHLGPAIARTPHDLVVEEFMPPLGFAMLPWWTRKPVVCIVQWFMFSFWEQRYKLPFEKIMRRMSRLGHYRHFIVQSEEMRTYFQELFPAANIWTLGCGVHDALFQAPGRPHGGYALFLGRLSVEHKGLDLLIEAWRQLRDAGVDIPLRIVGEGLGRAFLEQQIAAHGLGDRITLLGLLEGEAKRRELQNSAFVVMPSRAETFGIVALEAMAAAKPVVAFDIDHLNEVLNPQWAMIVGPPDASALAQGARQLWTGQELADRLGIAASGAAAGRSWSEVAAAQEAIYREIKEIESIRNK